MKKSIFLLGLLTSVVCLTACGSKTFEMSFEDALDIAIHSEMQDILAGNDNFEQSLAIAGNYNADGNSIDANISSISKQNSNNNNGESSTKFAANITSSGESIKIDGALDLKIVDNAIYLNLSALDLTGSEDLSFITMMTEGVKNQWFYIPMSGLNDMPNSFSILKDSKELNDKAKEIIINDGLVVYSGEFSQFNGYNAWKFSLDNEKLNALIREYFNAMYNSLDEEIYEEIPELNIQNFEGYLVITGKDKVSTVIESMDIVEDDIIVNANGFAGEDFELYLTEGEEDLISIVAQKKGGKYEFSVTIANAGSLIGTISPKLSKSSIDLNFDAKIIVKSEEEGEEDTVIPFNGSWKYKAISEFTTEIPESAQDLTELLGSYFGEMMGGDDYDYDYDYDYEDFDDNEYLEDSSIEITPEEVTEAE